MNRRDFLANLAISAGAWNVVSLLATNGWASVSSRTSGEPDCVRRLIIVFSPNGVVPDDFWPKQQGREFELPRILKPLADFQSQMLVLKGIDNRVRGDGDDHMRGMSCLLTGIELAKGNIQGGSNTPAGWPRGPSIDQVIARHLQSLPESVCRFGSLEFGVRVPERADVWTRMVYAGASQPVTPVSTPSRMMKKLYGQSLDRESSLISLQATSGEIRRLTNRIGSEDRHMLEQHLAMLEQSERRVREQPGVEDLQAPEVDLDIPDDDDHMPGLSDAQQEILVNALRTSLTRICSLQYTNAVGNPKMTFLGINESHHELSHEPDEKTEAMEKLVTINTWYAAQVAALARRLANVPEPDGAGNMLDNTTIIWTNELGKGSSHTLSNIPMVIVGGGAGWEMGRSVALDHVPHNRLWLSLASAMGLRLETFGNPEFCKGGEISELRG